MTNSRDDMGRYGVAVGLVAAATLVRFLLDPYLADTVPFVTYFAAIAASVWHGRFWSGVLATALSLIAAVWFFIPPRYTFSFQETDKVAWVTVAVFVLTGLTIASASEAMHRSRARVQAVSDAVAAQRQWLQVTLSSIGDAVIATDDEGLVSFMNPVAERLTGWASEEAAGIPFAEVFHAVNEHTGEPVEDACKKVMRTGRMVGLANHTVLVSKDGTRWPIDDSAAPILDATERVLGVVVVFRDATEGRRAFEGLERLAAIVEHSDEVIVGKRLDGTITSWNAAAERLYGFGAKEAVGQHISIVVPPDRRTELDTIMGRVRSGEHTNRLETVRTRKDGSLVDVVVTVSPIRNRYGENVGASTIARDVTEQKRAQEALRISEERLRLALNAGGLGVWDWDIPTDRLAWTERVYEMHGVEPEGFRGVVDDFKRLVHHEDAARVEDAIGRALRGDAHYDIEFRIVRPSGETRWLYTSALVLRDDAGRPVRMLGATMDVTDRKTAEENLRILKEASEAVVGLVDIETTMQRLTRLAVPLLADWSLAHLVDDDGEIEQIARAHADPEREPLVDECFRRYPPDWNRTSAIVRVLRSGEPEIAKGRKAVVAVDAHHRDLLERLALRSCVVVPLRRRERVIGTMSFMRAEGREPFSERDADLARELARRAAIAIDNCRLYDELKQSDRQKDEFLAMLAHELRNPLAAIDYAVRLVDASPEHASSMVEIVARQVGQLSRLIDDLLDVSRITRNKIQLHREAIDAATLVKRAIATVRSLMEERDHRLVTKLAESEMPLFVDPTRVEQIIVNLLTNAAKYTPREGGIVVEAFPDSEDIVIQVQDSGIGLRHEMVPRIFELFTQVDATMDRTQGGLGIGLPVARRLVEMHGGTIAASSEGPNQGSAFTVRLPRNRAGAMVETMSESAPSLRKGLRVLVVDDNSDTAASSAMLLETMGCVTRQAHDGPSAIASAESFQPDLVLLDIGLPGLDGYEVARRLRRSSSLDGRKLKLLAVTGYGQPRDRERSEEAGFDGHFTKPLKLEKLVELLADEGEDFPERS